jgi:hypothetical protein
MSTMKNQLFFAFSVASLVAGCGSSTNNTVPDMSTPPPADMTVVVVNPVKPAIRATQIERMGRPTINVAVTNPFNLDYTAQNGTTTTDATRDKYNADGNQSGWKTSWTSTLAKTLAIYDGVDMKCGNQFGACGMAAGCGVAAPAVGRYNTLAGVLADDQLYMDTTQTNCSFYLAVEANVLSVPGTAAFCGGRALSAQVVHETYTAAAVGVTGFPVAPATAFAVTDGVTGTGNGQVSATFPFLANPN